MLNSFKKYIESNHNLDTLKYDKNKKYVQYIIFKNKYNKSSILKYNV